MGDGRCLGVSVAAEAPGQFDVEGVEVDVADALEQLGGSGSWPGASGRLLAPGLVLGLQAWSRSVPAARSAIGGGNGVRHALRDFGRADGAPANRLRLPRRPPPPPNRSWRDTTVRSLRDAVAPRVRSA